MTAQELIDRVGEVELATLVKEVPARAGAYLYELKFDGYRIVAAKHGRDVLLASRRAQDWTEEFAPVAQAVRRLDARQIVLDGEVCALDDRGVPSFQLLQNRQSRAPRLVYFVFDLLWEAGEDLRRLPIEARRARLLKLLPNQDGVLTLSAAHETEPRDFLRRACAAGLEGIIAKAKGSAYVPGRGSAWLKIKCSLRQEFAVVGYLPLLGSQIGVVGSLLLALKGSDGALHFAGKVGTGFDDAARRSLGAKLEADRVEAAPIADAPRLGGVARWARPKLVAEVAFTEWTAGGHVRHPSFQGLRKDKRPMDCVRE